MSSELKTTNTTTASSDATPTFQLNVKKMKELAEQANAIKIGGKVCRFDPKENSFSTFNLGYSSSKEENHSPCRQCRR